MEEQTKQQQTWWQKHSKLLMRIGLIALVVVVIVLIILIILGYIFNWDWTGLTATDFKTQKTTNIIVYQPGKTLWDWLELLGVLAVPVVVGFGAAWFTRTQQLRDQERERLQNERDQEGTRLQHERDIQLADQRAKIEHEAAEKRVQDEREIALDNQREAALQAYINAMSELLLEKHLNELTPERKLKPEYEEVRKIARVRTLTVLHRLDPIRKRKVLQFLQEADLINKRHSIIDLSEADLSEADLSGIKLLSANLSKTNLRKADLKIAILYDADLSEADLSEAKTYNLGMTILVAAVSIPLKTDLASTIITVNFHRAWLVGANLSGVDLGGVDLGGANLSGATVTTEQLEKAKSLKWATMPDGSKHP